MLQREAAARTTDDDGAEISTLPPDAEILSRD